MKSVLALLLTGLCGAWAQPSAAFEPVLTVPAEPSAGQATTLVFRALTISPTDFGTGPVASVTDDGIRIDLNALCLGGNCDFINELLYRVEIPALDEGEYQVQRFSGASSTEPFAGQGFVFSVGPAVELPSVRPAQGAWSRPFKPGTGLYLQTRGPLLSVAQFDYQQDQSLWRLEAVPLRGDSAVVWLQRFSDGSCFGCDPYEAPSNRIGYRPILITFESARRARVDLLDGTVVPIVSLPFGVDYLPVTLADPLDAEFGPLPLPDLSGRWSVLDRFVVEFGPAQVSEGRAYFPPSTPGATIEMICETTVADGAGCAIRIGDNSILGQPLPPFGYAVLGNVEENRIRMEGRNSETEDFYMVRIPTTD